MRTHCVRGAMVLIALAGTAPADVITDWNVVFRQAIRETGGPPGPISRIGALMHTAMFDAVNSVEQTHFPYHSMVPTPIGTSKEAAAAQAAHMVLSQTYGAANPGLQAQFDAVLNTHLSAIPDGPSKTAGIALGISCATGMMGLRAGDGWDNNTPYVPGGNIGDWGPTYPDFSPAATPNWGNVSPWAMTHSSQFRPQGVGAGQYTTMADLLQSAEYAQQFNEVKSLGALNSATRTQEQTEIAFFWANDVDGTYKPPGHLNSITHDVSVQQGLSFSENARLFALVNLAMADAGIAAWDAKYNTDIDLWRPIDGIRNAHLDGNAGTEADPNWEPLNPFTPNFPAWISGHATFGAAHAAAMAGFFGADDIAFTASSEDPFYATLMGMPGDRSFSSFSEAAIENGLSRVYLGVHWRWDFDDAFITGMSLGDWVTSNYLLPIPTPGGAGVLALAGLALLRRRR